MTTTPSPAIDPVCGMSVDPAKSSATTYQNQTYFFCCPHCLNKFKADPKLALQKAAEREARKHAKPEPQLVTIGLGAPTKPSCC